MLIFEIWIWLYKQGADIDIEKFSDNDSRLGFTLNKEDKLSNKMEIEAHQEKIRQIAIVWTNIQKLINILQLMKETQLGAYGNFLSTMSNGQEQK